MPRIVNGVTRTLERSILEAAGYDVVVRGLRNLEPYAATALLLMSADASADQMQQAMAAGATALLRTGSPETEQLSAALSERLLHAA